MQWSCRHSLHPESHAVARHVRLKRSRSPPFFRSDPLGNEQSLGRSQPVLIRLEMKSATPRQISMH
ncbi:hypothetical protein BGLA2_280027 [Burkholderia gladioli]|nr:hypothetical protein BGLA2_280027 [Burkholderia gladioli]